MMTTESDLSKTVEESGLKCATQVQQAFWTNMKPFVDQIPESERDQYFGRYIDYFMRSMAATLLEMTDYGIGVDELLKQSFALHLKDIRQVKEKGASV